MNWLGKIRKLSCNSYNRFESIYKKQESHELKQRLKKLWVVPVAISLAYVLLLLVLSMINDSGSFMTSFLATLPALYVVLEEERRQRKRAILKILYERGEGS